MMQSLYLAKSGLQTVPLWLILFAASCDGNGIFEDAVVLP